MKALKLFGAALLALASVAMVQAQTTIRITGSTAFRNATETAIQNILNTGFTWGGVGGAAIGKNQLIFVGTLRSNSASVIIKTSFTGSEGGVFDLTHPGSSQVSTRYVANSAIGSLTTSGTNISSSLATEAATADISLGDTFQVSSAFNSPTLADSIVGIVPFTFVGATGNDALITNVTHQQLKAALSGLATYNLWSEGTDPVFDLGVFVRVVGRDEDSGTRANAFAESGFGIFSSATQFQPVGTSLNPWPASIVNGKSYPLGDSGYSSGGTLAGVLTDPNTTVSADVISYLGKSDAVTALTAATPATALSWEGVKWITGVSGGVVSYDDNAIFTGKYTFWSYEHLFTFGISGVQANVASDIVARLTGANTDANVSGYHVNQMKVKRLTDGGPVFNN